MNPYQKPSARIDQTGIIPLSERTKFYQEIHEKLLELERLDPSGVIEIKCYIEILIKSRRKKQEKKGATIIQFEGGS